MTWAISTAQMVRLKESGTRASTAAPITTVGSTNSAVISPSSSVRPRKAYRANTYAGARPTTMVRTVETTACQSVNHTTRHVRDDESVSATTSPSTAVVSSVTNGHA